VAECEERDGLGSYWPLLPLTKFQLINSKNVFEHNDVLIFNSLELQQVMRLKKHPPMGLESMSLIHYVSPA
jgi:hypothetical protein